jgi:hypothetical protein
MLLHIFCCVNPLLGFMEGHVVVTVNNDDVFLDLLAIQWALPDNHSDARVAVSLVLRIWSVQLLTDLRLWESEQICSHRLGLLSIIESHSWGLALVILVCGHSKDNLATTSRTEVAR